MSSSLSRTWGRSRTWPKALGGFAKKPTNPKRNLRFQLGHACLAWKKNRRWIRFSFHVSRSPPPIGTCGNVSPSDLLQKDDVSSPWIPKRRRVGIKFPFNDLKFTSLLVVQKGSLHMLQTNNVRPVPVITVFHPAEVMKSAPFKTGNNNDPLAIPEMKTVVVFKCNDPRKMCIYINRHFFNICIYICLKEKAFLFPTPICQSSVSNPAAARAR